MGCIASKNKSKRIFAPQIPNDNKRKEEEEST
jgi:hypothetical protein